MKLSQLLTLSILCTVVLFTACNNDSDVRDAAREALPEATAATATPSAPAAPAATPSTNPNEPHYKCPNNCAGGVGDGAGNCPVCGTALAHNQAYHNNPTPSATPSTTITPGTPNATPASEANSPAQNAAGVFHYTCPKGCAGGAAGAGSCATCGAALAHNADYHK